MTYLEQTKADGEEILASFNINSWIFISVFFQVVVGFLIIIINNTVDLDLLSNKFIDNGLIHNIISFLGFIIIAKSIYDYFLLKSINMGITNKRVVFKKGIISRNSDEIRLDAIETVDINQSILGRMMNYGDVKITGKGDSTVLFKDVDTPLSIKKDISSVINHYIK